MKSKQTRPRVTPLSWLDTLIIPVVLGATIASTVALALAQIGGAI